MLFEGLKQVSRGRDEVARKVPGQVQRETGEPRRLAGTRKLCVCLGLRWWPDLWWGPKGCQEMMELRDTQEVLLTGRGDGLRRQGVEASGRIAGAGGMRVGQSQAPFGCAGGLEVETIIRI